MTNPPPTTPHAGALMINRMSYGLPTILLSAAWVAGLPGYLFYSSGTVKPLYWILATVIWFGAMLLPRARECWPLSSRLPVAWGFCYSLLLLWQLVRSGDPDHKIINHFEAIAVFFSVGFALLLHPDQRRHVQIGILAGVLISAFLNIAEFFSPLYCQYRSLYPSQVSGLHINANTSAQLIVFGLICSWNLVPKFLRSSYVLICLMSVGLTYSRSGWILMALAVACLLFRDWSRREDRAANTVGLVVGLLVLFLCVEWLAPAMCQHLYLGFEYKLKVFGGDLSDFSTQTRMAAISRAFEQFIQFPILGEGFGSATSTQGVAGPHNIYLLFAAEMGIIGLGLYLWFVLRVYESTFGAARLLVIIYAVSGLFTHNNFESIAIMLLLAFAVTGLEQSTETNHWLSRRAIE